MRASRAAMIASLATISARSRAMVAPAAGSGAPAAGSPGTPPLTVLLALLVCRARPWQADTGTAPSSGSTQPCVRGSQQGQAVRATATDAAQGRPPTTMWRLHALHGPALQP
jgi:hypothetical protein